MRSLYIDGAWRDSASDEAIDVVNPATEQVIDTVPAGAAVAVGRHGRPQHEGAHAVGRVEVHACPFHHSFVDQDRRAGDARCEPAMRSWNTAAEAWNVAAAIDNVTAMPQAFTQKSLH